MTTATTSKPVSFTMAISYTDTHLTLTGADSDGQKSLTIDLARALPIATDAEAVLINETRGCGEKGQEFFADFTVAELRTLKGLKDRSEAKPSKADMAKTIIAKSNTGAKVEAMAMRAARNSQGRDWTEYRLNQLDAAARTLDGDVWYIDMDMSKELRAELDDPCGVMWKLGAVSISESVFVMRDADYQSEAAQSTFAMWREAGISELNAHREHPEDVAKLQARIRRRLEKEIAGLKASLTTNILAADDRLATAQKELDAREQPATEKERQQADANRDNRVRAIIRDAWKDLATIIKSAEKFEEADSLAEVTETRRAIAAQAAEFNAKMVAIHGHRAHRLLVATV